MTFNSIISDLNSMRTAYLEKNALFSWDTVTLSAKGAAPAGALKNKRKGIMTDVFF